MWLTSAASAADYFLQESLYGSLGEHKPVNFIGFSFKYILRETVHLFGDCGR